MSASLLSFIRRVGRWPLGVWLLLLGVVLLIRFPVKFLLEPPHMMDLEAYHVIASRIFDGHAIQIYEPMSERMVFKYAPCWAMFLAPLGWVSLHTAGVLWSGLNVAWLLLTCWVSDRLCRAMGLSLPGWLGIAALLVLVRPITSEFLLGQADLLWGFLVVAALLCHATRRRWRAAAFLALAISLKLPALLLLPYFLLRRHWGALVRTIACFAVFNIAAAWWLAPTRPFALWLSWYQALRGNAATYAFDIGNQSLLALMGRLLRDDGYGFNLLALPDSTVFLIWTGVGAVLFGAVFVPRLSRLSPAARPIIEGAFLMVLMVIGSPSSWVATYSALLFPVLLALALLFERPRDAWGSLPLTCGLLMAGAFSAMTHSKFWRFVHIRQIHGETYVYLVLMILPLLGLSLAWCLWHQRSILARRA